MPRSQLNDRLQKRERNESRKQEGQTNIVLLMTTGRNFDQAFSDKIHTNSRISTEQTVYI